LLVPTSSKEPFFYLANQAKTLEPAIPPRTSPV
jgi:hypothetical protein